MDRSSESTTSEDAPSEKSLLDRLRSLLRFKAAPDTTKELESEIHELLEEGEEQGLITRQEERLISSIFDFRETMASEIMTPSAELVCAEEGATVEELVRIINEEGYTRIPIYRENQDQVIGILHAKDLLKLCAGGSSELSVAELLNPPTFVSESKPITELLREFQATKNHMAIVVDEFHGVRGLITLEDVIEEIVGEIDDEHDQEESELRVVDEHSVIVDAKIDIEEVEAHFGVALPEGPYESVGGFIIHRLGKVPETGAQVEEGILLFRVLGADQRRIKTVRVARQHGDA
ncbi:hemolysin family protein [Desulfogranum mediterraneum]|uniref:hemolysin family protein n=1 Tax=Desulfogranum mediterraneum TaxID=160661 RepID=UPI00048F3DC5|nr:hemolysin family protein [Desulfogranum mediterraneum]